MLGAGGWEFSNKFRWVLLMQVLSLHAANEMLLLLGKFYVSVEVCEDVGTCFLFLLPPS